MLSNLDSFLRGHHNYYIYMNPADGRMSWLPWDVHLSMRFGGVQRVVLSIEHPWTSYNLLCHRLMSIDWARRSYEQHLRKLAEILDPARVDPHIDALEAVVKQAQQSAH